MTITVIFPKAEKLIWKLFNKLPEHHQQEFLKEVQDVTTKLDHPISLDSDITCSFGLDNTN